MTQNPTDQAAPKPTDGIKGELLKRRGMLEDVRARSEIDAMPRNQVEAGLVQLETQLANMLPGTMSKEKAARLVHSTIQLIRNDNSGLLVQCGPSLMGGVLTAGQLGLEVGTPALGEAYLIPLWNKNKKVPDPNNPDRFRSGGFDAQLIIGYKGFRKLSYQSAAIKSMSREIVYSNDEFDILYGSERKIHHKRKIGEDRGDVIGYYAIVWNIFGGEVSKFMDLAEMREHRDRFAMAKKKDGTIVGPWRDDFNSMGLKTVLKKALADSPMSIEDKLALAVHLDQTVRTDITEDYEDPSDILNVAQHLNTFTPDNVNTFEGETIPEPAEEDSQPADNDAPPAQDPPPPPPGPAPIREEQKVTIREYADNDGEKDYDLYVSSVVGREGLVLDQLTEVQAGIVIQMLIDKKA